MSEYYEVYSHGGKFVGVAANARDALALGERNMGRYGDFEIFFVNEYSLKSN